MPPLTTDHRDGNTIPFLQKPFFTFAEAVARSFEIGVFPVAMRNEAA
jgi:hypothetical protein